MRNETDAQQKTEARQLISGQEYFLHRKKVNHWADQTLKIFYSGVKFFYRNVLKQRRYKKSRGRVSNPPPTVLPPFKMRFVGF
jgi:hypothetical protein